MKSAPRSTTAVGAAAEDIAVLALQREGYVIVGRNLRIGRGEIDVLARDGTVLCFVEVRRRKTASEALLSIDARKQARLVRAAQGLVVRERITEPCRFDVVVVHGHGSADIIKAAFEVPA